MSCEETRRLLDAYLDGELDLVHSLELEGHLADCANCSVIYRNWQILREQLAGERLYFRPPPDLQRRIRRSLHGSRSILIPRWAAAAVVIMLVLSGIGAAWIAARSPSTSDQLVAELLASHIRSLMGDHLKDVASTDQHTVKPWFDGRLDFSPPVVDLATAGFPLVGGRLDYLDHRPVAALVYQRRLHIINLFIWPSGETEAPLEIVSSGYQIDHWTQAGMSCWAVSDVASSDLVEFGKQFQAATNPQSQVRIG